jgi:hypothetical protein
MLFVYHWDLKLKIDWLRSRRRLEQAQGAGWGGHVPLLDDPKLGALLAVQSVNVLAFVACYAGVLSSLAPVLTPRACGAGAGGGEGGGGGAGAGAGGAQLPAP